MPDFRFILDAQPMHAQNLAYAGGIEEKEFEQAQELKLTENHFDYYGKFCWGSQQVKQKRAMLPPIIEVPIPNLVAIIKHAFAGECSLVAQPVAFVVHR